MTMTAYGIDLDEFVDAYIEAALWATNDESDESGGDPLDDNYDRDDVAPEAMEKIRDDCRKFLDHPDGGGLIDKALDLNAAGEWGVPHGAKCSIPAYAGHDFFLTRCGHGCGFWDGDWPGEMEVRLTNLAESFGEVWFYVGDDGKIYV